MASNDYELSQECISFAGYTEEELTDENAMQAVEQAKQHLKLEGSLTEEDINWYGNNYQRQALFWTTMLFTKLQSGQLDSKAISVAAIEESKLLAKNESTVTQWYENYERELGRLQAEFTDVAKVTNPSRTARSGDRYYSSERN